MASGLAFLAAPRISSPHFARILDDAGSPASPEAAACYEAATSRGIDPAVMLAFFQHESTYGRKGVATATHNWGNLRKGGRALYHRAGWAWYISWADSAADWCDLILNRYVGRGLDTVGEALPVYAPSSDGNAPARYAAAVEALVTRWQAAEQATADRRYRVSGEDGAYVRPDPSRRKPALALLARGQVVTVDHIVADGSSVTIGDLTSRRWARIVAPRVGYVWAGLLSAMEGE